jgi:hypothetical protein
MHKKIFRPSFRLCKNQYDFRIRLFNLVRKKSKKKLSDSEIVRLLLFVLSDDEKLRQELIGKIVLAGEK